METNTSDESGNWEKTKEGINLVAGVLWVARQLEKNDESVLRSTQLNANERNTDSVEKQKKRIKQAIVSENEKALAKFLWLVEWRITMYWCVNCIFLPFQTH